MPVELIRRTVRYCAENGENVTDLLSRASEQLRIDEPLARDAVGHIRSESILPNRPPTNYAELVYRVPSGTPEYIFGGHNQEFATASWAHEYKQIVLNELAYQRSRSDTDRGLSHDLARYRQGRESRTMSPLLEDWGLSAP